MLMLSQESLITKPGSAEMIHLHNTPWGYSWGWAGERIIPAVSLRIPPSPPHVYMIIIINQIKSICLPELLCSWARILCSGLNHQWQSWWRDSCRTRWWCQEWDWSLHSIYQSQWSSQCLHPWSPGSRTHSSSCPQYQNLWTAAGSVDQAELILCTCIVCAGDSLLGDTETY